MRSSQRHFQALVAMAIKSKAVFLLETFFDYKFVLYKKKGSSRFREAHGSSHGLSGISSETYQGTTRQVLLDT